MSARPDSHPDGTAVVGRLARASQAERSARTEAARRRIDDEHFVAEDTDE